ncbi:hypothetical protein AVDCRST_MAG81-5205 [uncultured Synechococcales cyanobacterium]|uniref:Uncharacterized protein n=1 Tax=uncultured Synechococcales cyanobacterium TaxID=1936017 RepID=A0A6J4VVF3_9CYAN|nr:hypothetical protein AVDCRST_MAG81-5205 [uncultured Synechococcales cyanobacterium]
MFVHLLLKVITSLCDNMMYDIHIYFLRTLSYTQHVTLKNNK